MDVGDPIRVQLCIERGAETISGRVAIDGAPPAEFFGWLELIRAARAGDPVRRARGDQGGDMGTRWTTTIAVITLALGMGAPAARAGFAGSTTLVSRPDGTGPVPPAFDNESSTPGALSADGRYAVFTSLADGFAPGTNPIVQSVLLRDRQTNTTTLVSRSDGLGAVAADQNASEPALAVTAAGGVLVAFTTGADNLVDHATGQLITPGAQSEVWLRDVTAGTTTLVSRPDGNTPVSANRDADAPSIDVAVIGPVVSFHSLASNLGATDAGLYLRTVDSGHTQLISCHSQNCGAPVTGTQDGASQSSVRVVRPALGTTCPPGLGRIQCVLVAFDTRDTTITGEPGTNTHEQVVEAVSELTTASTTTPPPAQWLPVSAADGLTAYGNDDSMDPSFNGDGRAIAFLSKATNLTSDAPLPAKPVEAYVRVVSGNGTGMLSKASAPADQPVGSVALGGSAASLRAVFTTNASNLGVAGIFRHVYLRDEATGQTSQLDRGSGSSGASGESSAAPGAAISADGSSALFSSRSDNLGDNPGNHDFTRVHVRSLPADPPSGPGAGSGTVELASRPSGMAPFPTTTESSLAGAGDISADARFVAFSSRSPSLPGPIDDRMGGVFLRDLLTGRTVLVSRASGANGAIANAEPSLDGISGDGKRVLFDTKATNISPAATGGVSEVYVRDLTTNTTTLVSRASGPGAAPAATNAFGGGISADGRAALIITTSPLDPAGANAAAHIYERDLTTNTTTLVDRDTGATGTVPTDFGFGAVPDADGGRVAWVSKAAIAGAPADTRFHVFVRDLRAHTTTFVSRADGPAGAAADTGADSPVIDGAGDAVAFVSSAQNFIGPVTGSQVYIRKLATARTELVSRASGATGAPANDAGSPSIDAAGDRVTYIDESVGTTLQFGEAFVRDSGAQTTTLVSRADGPQGAAADAFGASDAAISASGDCVAFTAESLNLGDGFRSSDFGSVHLRVLRRECPVDPPDTAITRGPLRVSVSNRPVFRFRAGEPAVRFQCRVDGRRFTPCRSPLRTAKLRDGAHIFTVRAVDRAGFADPTPAVRRFTVDPLIGKPLLAPTPLRLGERATISFLLARGARVTLVISQLRGRHRRTLRVSGKHGRDHIRFSAAGLPPARYRLTATALHGLSHATTFRLVG